ncbi:Rps23 Pro-64 3,4-dihydroxylase Tpa1-like proline 4-hydroxylase [Sphingomonas zeicaulis]|uniref:2OG-Fe(II) oxygenase n=1 Tax=Sphingomonas zeicaulis TaxID=1632740 RepID=UPI003D225F03
MAEEKQPRMTMPQDGSGHRFTVSPNLDIIALQAAFRRTGRVEIVDFIAPADAQALRAHLQARADWRLVLNAGVAVYEFPRAGVAQFTEAQRRELDSRIAVAARDGFQYRYETIRVPDASENRGTTMLDSFVAFMGSPPVLAVVRAILGEDRVAFADGQATAYSPGDFLTRHDDDVSGKHRHAAYVLGLSPGWRAEWGGLLMFHRDDGNIDEGFVPALGALRLFAVPALHSVSYVTPSASEPRLAVTGWFREHPGLSD